MESSPFSLARWKDIKIEEFYHPSLQYYLKPFMDFTFACSCLLYIFTTYVILTQSNSRMATFKTTILMQLTFNIIYEITLFLVKPIIHLPLLFISYDGYFNFEKIWRITILAFLFFLVVGGIAAFITSLLQRVESVFTYECENHHFNILFGHLIATVIVSITLLVPLYMVFGETDESMQKQIPSLFQLYHILPSTIGVDPANNPIAIISFIIICGFWVAFFAVAFSGLNTLFFLKLRKIKKIMSKETFALQKMLHRTLIIQMILAIFFMLIPMLILTAAVLCQNINASWIVNLALPISSIHMIFDCPCILYFIKPYRIFVCKLLGRKNSTIVIITPITSQNLSFA